MISSVRPLLVSDPCSICITHPFLSFRVFVDLDSAHTYSMSLLFLLRSFGYAIPPTTSTLFSPSFVSITPLMVYKLTGLSPLGPFSSSGSLVLFYMRRWV